MNSCALCGGATSVVYTGRIREGRVGEYSQNDCRIFECGACGVRSLERTGVNDAAQYESDDYRTRVDGAPGTDCYFSRHDAEQLRHLTMVGTGAFRDKTVVDVGCGGGSFLDYVAEVARTVVAIEPSRTYRASLERRGYATFPYVADAIESFKGSVDFATSFSVIEHVERPDQFLREIRQLLRQGEGQLIISTPNADDALLTLLPVEYRRFFYRRVHLWYWTAAALKQLLLTCGYIDPVVMPVQRFGLGNFLGWLRDRVPQGDLRFDVTTPAIDAVWKAELQRTGQCDYLFALARA